MRPFYTGEELCMRHLLRLCAVSLGLLVLAACGQHRTTDTGRTAVEQLLLSTAADQAMAEIDLGALQGRKVYLDPSHFDSVDKAYVIDLVRDSLGAIGARLMAERADADTIVEIRSGALGTERSDYLVGIPAIPVPIPLAGTLVTPELALYKQDTQRAIAKFALHATDQATGAQLIRSGAVSGKAYNTRRVILFVPYRTTDVPELR